MRQDAARDSTPPAPQSGLRWPTALQVSRLAPGELSRKCSSDVDASPSSRLHLKTHSVLSADGIINTESQIPQKPRGARAAGTETQHGCWQRRGQWTTGTVATLVRRGRAPGARPGTGGQATPRPPPTRLHRVGDREPERAALGPRLPGRLPRQPGGALCSPPASATVPGQEWGPG